MAAPLHGEDGLIWAPGWLDRAAQQVLLEDVRAVLRRAPLYTPTMPRSGAPLSVRMSNAGALGWVTDKQDGYRYQATHPATGAPWPPIPARLLALWSDILPDAPPPEACLINWYGQAGARMGLHRDRDEEDLETPVLSVSLGADAWFRLGGLRRGDPTRRMKLSSGDVLALAGKSRHFYHGIDRIVPDSSTLLTSPQRLNLTLRRVTRA
ncbi:MAG: alpha-ketoglutarate-dependent dioxygenase AlkB [Alphaproteobacteria bacterium]|nr:alpha-ketoglutarate-dependent dioxygenase AlkB [Alphaproteobacteria bacterium]